MSSSSSYRHCTCSPLPAIVDLTEAFFAFEDCRKDEKDPLNENVSLLLENFTRYGWSPVQIVVSRDKEARRGALLHQSPSEWKEKLVALFQDPQIQSTEGVKYRQAESGKPGTVEPKESLETQRGGQPPQSTAGVFLREYANLLHRVACAVRRALDFPSNVLLQEEDEDAGDTASAVDLMRVFYYQTVAQQPKVSPVTLGSNEHTDWGSFTVVWQDQVGGLQTYCHACQKWTDVVVTSEQQQQQHQEDTSWEFIVHVGDFTSICIGCALQEEENKETLKQGNNDLDLPPTVVWPSPKHRVVSPTQQRRLSLVYFAYPPAAASLQNMQNKLHDWCRANLSSLTTNKTKTCVPWTDYYVLRNQSSKKAELDQPHDMYQKIVGSPVKEVLLEKWKQVQR